jgi:hypothetical protein
MFSNAFLRSKWLPALCAAITILLIAATYWPVAHAQFVYDDILDFQKMAWLRHGDHWQQLLLRKFNDWVNYFRPLGVALFTLEVRAFDVKPGPMHLVSLALHLINVLLVGALATQIADATTPYRRHPWVSIVPMLLYGLHPVLVEPVVWIGCQFELTATLFMLLGWIANISVRRLWLRALYVSACFFLAACSKESALAFPFILIVFDWLIRTNLPTTNKLGRIKTLAIHNWATYVGIVFAGIIYLILRHWALGGLLPGNGTHPLPLAARMQEASFLYLRYWRMFFWPVQGMGPIHPVPAQQFLSFSLFSGMQDIGALCILLIGIYLTIQRRCAGGLILCVTFALLPVLHIVAAKFDKSLYHERYAMTALAMACTWLPATFLQVLTRIHIRRMLTLGSMIIFGVWVAISAMTVRVTVPLWSSQIKLWQWALEGYPDSIDAKDELISAYVGERAYASAWKLIDDVLQRKERCMNCMLNAAILSLQEGDIQKASSFLQGIKDTPELYADPTAYRTYLTVIAQVELLENHPDKAETAAKAAIDLDSFDPTPHLVLAAALARQGKPADAIRAENAGNALLPPDEQPEQRQKFEALLNGRNADGKREQQ